MDVHVVNRLIPGETQRVLRFEAEIPLLKQVQKDINIDKPTNPSGAQQQKDLKQTRCARNAKL